MRCLYCQKRIGILRRFADREYCSRDHRRRMLARSARAARNASAEGEFDEVWPVYLSTRGEDEARNNQSNIFSTATFGIFIVIALLVGSMGLSGPSNGNPKYAANGPMEDLRKVIRNHAAVRLNDDFHGGLKGWQPAGKTAVASGQDWTFNHGFVQPGRLRIWKDSSKMTDYQMEFVGQIERKGFGWVYRASDSQNFYASKLAVVKPGPLPSTDLVRYAVVGGRESAHVSVPIPFNVRTDTLYRVQVNVRGNNFSTRVNGQMVDAWSDSRLPQGGVGFFAEAGEQASLRWVTVSHRDDFVGRLLSYLGFIQPIEPLVYYAYLPVIK